MKRYRFTFRKPLTPAPSTHVPGVIYTLDKRLVIDVDTANRLETLVSRTLWISQVQYEVLGAKEFEVRLEKTVLLPEGISTQFLSQAFDLDSDWDSLLNAEPYQLCWNVRTALNTINQGNNDLQPIELNARLVR
jgi:hypothetical protein